MAWTKNEGANHTHLSELLSEREGIEIGRTTLRRILVRAGLSSSRSRRPPKHWVRRQRMPMAGMLIQLDGSHHPWVGEQTPPFTLLTAVDDATGTVAGALSCQQEDALGYFLLLESLIERCGEPVALYTDRYGVFRHTPGSGLPEMPTQFSRAMEELGIQMVFALSPQRKGRVERAAGTFQDRLVTELRLARASNKQLNFLQHVRTLLNNQGRAAIVVPDNVLFEDGAGERVRRKLLAECDVHTLLRLPTGIFYAQGVKANVLFFDRKPASETPWTRELWIYDLRTNQHFTRVARPMTRAHLDDFVACYNAENRLQRAETELFQRFSYDDLVKRDKANLDIFWLRDESMEDSANLPPPDVIAEEILEDLSSALEQLEEIAGDLAREGT